MCGGGVEVFLMPLVARCIEVCIWRMLSQWFWQADVQILSKPPAPRNACPIYRFLASRQCGPVGRLSLLLIKEGEVETNPG